MKEELHRTLPSRTRVALLLAFAAVALFSWAGIAGAEQADGQYAGSETCGECHEDLANALKSTHHGREGFAKLSSHGCETCHGPAKAHTENSNDASLRPSISKLSVKDRNAMCAGCHAGGQQMLWEGSRHDLRGVGCTDCHGVHEFASDNGQLKGETAADTCYQCHKDVRAEMQKTSHHPVREGKIGCNDCHNPHGSQTPKMLVGESLNDTCYQCHAEKRGPFLWEHAPVRENCANCHLPHGSNHLKLQRTANPYLCQQCHSNTRHPGTLYDATTLPGAARQSNRIIERGCVNCHAAIHGSNAPSGPYLGR